MTGRAGTERRQQPLLAKAERGSLNEDARPRDGYGRCANCGLVEGHIETCRYARKRGTLTLRASVVVSGQHEVSKYLRDLERQLANTFSIAVHDYYPDATVSTVVEVEDV